MDEQREKQLRAEIEAKLAKEAAIRAEIEAKLAKELKEKQLNQLNAKANAGDAEAQFELAECFFYGKDVEKNYLVAIEWYTSAAKNGLTEAQRKLYDCYLYGKGVEKDVDVAIRWLTVLADSGDAELQFNLAERYANGIDVKVDKSTAFNYYLLSAEQGIWLSMCKLGIEYYLCGDGVEIDYERSVYWLRKAIDAYGENDSSEIMQLAREAYAEALLNYGKQLEHNNSDDYALRTAFECYKESAEYGSSDGIARMGHFYQCGTCVHKDLLAANDSYIKAIRMGCSDSDLDGWMKDLEDYVCSNPKEEVSQSILSSWYDAGDNCCEAGNESSAFAWYTRAAQSGCLKARRELYYCYRNGVYVDKNIDAAIKWLTSAADDGDSELQFTLGKMYADGDNVYRDASMAFHYFSLSAEQGYYLSELELGKCYLFGYGVDKDFEKAVYWLDLVYRESQGEVVINFLASALAYYGYELEQQNPAKETQSKILQYYERSAAFGNKYGMAYLGHCFHYGFGTEVDLFKADELYVKAKNNGLFDSSFNQWMKELDDAVYEKAESGEASSHGVLGVRFLTGSHGEKNPDKAFFWLSKGANQGNCVAQHYMGEYFVQKEDFDKAFFWFKKAAPYCVKSMVSLGEICYMKGKGVKQDLAMAKYWIGWAYYIENIRTSNIKELYESLDRKCLHYDCDKSYDHLKKKLDTEVATNKSLFNDSISLVID